MAQATVTQAEAALADLSGLSDNQRRQYQAEVDAARQAAIAAGEDEAARIAADVGSYRDDVLAELCEVRDALAAAQSGGDRSDLSGLRTRHRALLAKVEEVERLVDQVEAIEADPFAYGEAVFAKYPLTRPKFSFI
ncbi:MAG TPA: hypothetical protein VHA73_14405 [Acidimicrobiales bacterium]|jgi:hypothetical protein|nr:hypothetical protein [Acidimicrobiales bacterium]